jgi:hypothetical protein
MSPHLLMSEGDEHSKIYKAARSGSLSAVRALVQQLQEQHASTETLERNLQDGLGAACSYKRTAIISYLLDHGAKLDEWLVGSATDKNTPVAIFETFLNHGWDFNELVSGRSPPLRQSLPPSTSRASADACYLDMSSGMPIWYVGFLRTERTQTNEITKTSFQSQ